MGLVNNEVFFDNKSFLHKSYQIFNKTTKTMLPDNFGALVAQTTVVLPLGISNHEANPHNAAGGHRLVETSQSNEAASLQVTPRARLT